MSTRPIVILAAALLALFLAGCGGSRERSANQRDIVSAIELAQQHNARVADLDRLWARATVQVTASNERGKRLREQAEGHLQIDGPDRFALSLGKIGKVQLYLGSNEQLYWWIDLVDSDQKSMLFGRHDQVSDLKAGTLGLPVYPRDALQLLAITPIDVASATVLRQGSRRGLSTPTTAGSRIIWFDENSPEPVRVEMRGQEGSPILSADLSSYQWVTVVGDATRKPRVASKIRIELASDGTRVDLTLYAPENRPIRPSAFDIEGLARAYGVEMLYDLDDQPTQAWPGP